MARISSRIGAIAPSATLAVDSQRQKHSRLQGRPVIGFGAGEPDFPTPAHIVDAAREALNDPKNFRYSPASGLPELKTGNRGKNPARLRRSEIDPSQVVITNGGKQAVYQAFATVIDEGDDVLLPCTRTGPPTPSASAWQAATPSRYSPVATSTIRSPSSSSKPAYTPATKALIFVSPSNPTGAVYTEEETRAIGEWALCQGHFRSDRRNLRTPHL